MSARRRRVLIFAEGVTLAHVARPLALCQGLDPNLYEVHFACSASYRNLLKHSSVVSCPIHSISSRQFLHSLDKGNVLYDTETLRKYVKEDLRVIDEIRPDVIVGDFRLSLSVSARKTSIPYLAITNAYWSPYARQAYTIPAHPLTKYLGLPLAKSVFTLTRPLVFAYHSLPLNRVRREYDLRPLGFDLRKIYTDADHVLYADIPELIPTYHLPSNHHYIGPVLWSPAVELPKCLNHLPADRPLVYITLGSSGACELLPDLLSGLANLPINVAVATATRIKLTDIPDNACVADYLPGEQVASLASLVICNGGSPTTQQGLAHGVPVLGISGNLDQYLNMSYLEQAGVGRIIRSEQATAQQIRDTAEMVMNTPDYGQHAKQVMRYMQSYNAVKNFTEVVANQF